MSRFFGLLALAALLCMSAVSGQTCGGAGYDLSSLRGQEFSITIAPYIWSVAPCGVLRNSTACPTPNYPDTSFCQTRIGAGNNGTSLAQYTAANSTWNQLLNGNGVVQEIQDGTFCAALGGANGGAPRETSIVYLCDATATTARLLNVSEVHTCFYTAYIATSAACTTTPNAATGPYAAVGTRYYDSRCGGGAYDLSPLQQQDLFWTPNANITTTVWFLRVCGAVSNANCSATNGQQGTGVPSETAMLCQSDQNNPTGNDHAASFYVPSQQLWTLPSYSGGLRMEIQDGQACGNFNRETTINFVCDPTATTAVMSSVVEAVTCYYTATVRTNLVCSNRLLLGSSTGGALLGSSTGSAVVPRSSSSSAGGTGGVLPPILVGSSSSSAAASGQVICGGAGYDLSSLAGTELSIYISPYIWSVAPCGVVRNTTACPFPNYPDTTFCQSRVGGNGTSIAQYTAGNSSWNQLLNGNGVEQEIVDGTFCAAEGGANGGGPREGRLVYLCDPTATTARLLNVSEPHTCFYTAYIATAAACSPVANAPTGPLSPVGTRYYDSRCGGGAYDLSPLQQQDLFWTPNASITTNVWFLRVCGAVSNANCSATNGQQGTGVPSETAMLCQSDQNNPTGNDHAAAFYVPSQQLWTLPSYSGGLRMEIQDGQACGSWNRETTLNFVCDPSATQAVLVSVVEPITCYYTATVRTNLVCPDRLLIGSSTGGAFLPRSSSSAGSASAASSSSSTVRQASSSSSSAAVPVVTSATSAAVVRSSSSSSSTAAVLSQTSSSSNAVIASSSSTAAPSSPQSSSSTADVVVPVDSSSSTAGSPPTLANGGVSVSASGVVVAGLLAVVALLM